MLAHTDFEKSHLLYNREELPSFMLEGAVYLTRLLK